MTFIHVILRNDCRCLATKCREIYLYKASREKSRQNEKNEKSVEIVGSYRKHAGNCQFFFFWRAAYQLQKMQQCKKMQKKRAKKVAKKAGGLMKTRRDPGTY